MRNGTNIATTRRRAPNRMTGKAQIGDFLRRVNADNIGLAIDDSRAAFRVTAVLGNDKRVIEMSSSRRRPARSRAKPMSRHGISD
jgi:hypothetical protein